MSIENMPQRKRLMLVIALGLTLSAAADVTAQVGPAPPLLPVPAQESEKKKDDNEKSPERTDSAAAKAEAKADAKKDGKTPAEPTSDWFQDLSDWLRSFSLKKLLDGVQERGPSVAIVLVIMTGVLWLANLLHGRVVRLLASAANRGSTFEQENRARTLVGVMHNTLRTTVYVLASLMILQAVGVPVGPLLGSVAVFGIAVAFGAQSLVKDFFTGFLVLLEQQYMIGDVVKISGNNFSGLTGQVEQISLRVTTLRDLEGAAHFISHGQITVVSNLTHGWSQAVFDLQVANSEPLERVQKEFCKLAGDLREDAKYGTMILNDAEMLGIDSLGDTMFIVKFVLRTLPLKRWEVKRELLRRIKQRFEELKIKVIIPA